MISIRYQYNLFSKETYSGRIQIILYRSKCLVDPKCSTNHCVRLSSIYQSIVRPISSFMPKVIEILNQTEPKRRKGQRSYYQYELKLLLTIQILAVKLDVNNFEMSSTWCRRNGCLDQNSIWNIADTTQRRMEYA